MTAPVRRIPIAVGILEDRDGNLLMQRRQPGRARTGDWEFPGGKIEEGEAPRAAVARELPEEVAVTVRRAAPWVRRTHTYPHGTFDLHLVQELEWKGEPKAAEPRRSAGSRATPPPPTRLLAANHSFWRRLELPRIAAISSAGISGAGRFLERWDTLQQEGVRLLQVRDKELPPGERTPLLEAAVARRRSPGTIVMLNGDPETARRHGTQGAHLDSARLMAATRRPDCEWVSASCHNRREVARAGELGADFAHLGLVRQTASHPRATPLGWERFAGLAADTPLRDRRDDARRPRRGAPPWGTRHRGTRRVHRAVTGIPVGCAPSTQPTPDRLAHHHRPTRYATRGIMLGRTSEEDKHAQAMEQGTRQRRRAGRVRGSLFRWP